MEKQLSVLASAMLVVLLITGCGDSAEERRAEAAEDARRERDWAAAQAALVPSPEVQARVKTFLQSQRLWCGKVVRFREDAFKSTVNNKVYFAFCDDGNNAQGYEIRVERGEFVSVEEV